MKTILSVLFFACSVYAIYNIPIETPVVNHRLISHINSLQTTWTASPDQGYISHMTRSQIKGLLGAKRGGAPILPKKTYNGKVAVPDSFDSRTAWVHCPSISFIRDQSACGSCWAFGAAEAMSDRICIHLGKNVSISADDLLACCDECGDGCDGGYPASAWSYWVETGLVSEECRPYPFPSCDHHIPNSKNPCPSSDYPTPPCQSTCQNNANYNNDKHFGADSNSVTGEDDIKAEIFQNGPVEVAFDVYEDFLTYKTGVYQHVSGDYLGGHAVRMLGWGTENGTPYWIVANSWNPTWGDHGFFKILRGSDECGIEDEADFGLPKN